MVGNASGFSLTPGLSPVQLHEKEKNRFNGFYSEEAVETAQLPWCVTPAKAVC